MDLAERNQAHRGRFVRHRHGIQRLPLPTHHHEHDFYFDTRYAVAAPPPARLTASDLSQDARILYVSNSIYEVLGFNPEEVLGRSCWDYFHPDELPFARSTHGRGVSLDRASVLTYCRIKSRSGWWIGCECVFTVVYDVLVGCTSVYHIDAKSQSCALCPALYSY